MCVVRPVHVLVALILFFSTRAPGGEEKSGEPRSGETRKARLPDAAGKPRRTTLLRLRALPSGEEVKEEKKEENKVDKKEENKEEKKEEAKKEEKKEDKNEAKKEGKKEEKAEKEAPKKAANHAQDVIIKKAEVKEEPEKEKKAEEKKKPKAPPKKQEPSAPLFRMRDGTRVAGYPDMKEIAITTAYGKLVVPIKDVFRIRFAGAQDPKLAGRIDELVQQLGSEEFDLREEAMNGLREIGTPALEKLQKAAESEDEEVKSRAEKLIAEVEEGVDESDDKNEHLTPIRGADDEVRTRKFIALGHVEQEDFAVNTPYGALNLNRNDILSLVFQESPFARHPFDIPGETFAAAGKWVDTELKVSRGTKFLIRASGSIQIQNYNTTTGPEGTTNITGNQLEKFPVGSLVGKVGEKGKPFLVGSEYSGEADAAGNIMLGISFNNGQINGQYQAEVEVEEEEL